MKKVFAFAAMFAAVAMVACGGQQKAAEEQTEEAQAMECCDECDGDCDECDGECCEAVLEAAEAIDEADLAEAVEYAEAAIEAAEELDFE
ncbi:MAG: hypothetical protein IKW31_06770 [Alistipes sp.]|nr:hypothetical protein [Alistipes sp.]